MTSLFKNVILLSTIFISITIASYSQTTERHYLSGTDKDNRVEWEFFCTEGMNSGQWTTIAVPSCWESEGFGNINYGHDKEPHNEKGFYRYEFNTSKKWRNKKVYIVFEGVMTDAEVKINHQSAGPVHQGGFYRFKYDISHLLKYGEKNLLEVMVNKESANKSINNAERRADYWIFGGIYRPVYLEIQPTDFIERIAINAKHDGSFYMETYINSPSQKNFEITAQIKNLHNENVGNLLSTQAQNQEGKYIIEGQVTNPKTWTAETPNLYKVVVCLKEGKKTIHQYSQTFGFRTIEFREGDGFYVNNVKVKFKGVCRHTFWPENGRTSSKEMAINDINLIKEMNMNAVRMSHYPPDSYFLDACDSLGLYVIDELAGWQDRYDTPTAHRLIKSMITRDVNHPSIVIWANGNEGGFPKDARTDYAIYDPQKRHVVEPWSLFDGLDARHYPKYDYTLEALTKKSNVYMPTEFLHGLHDGGSGAGLEDYWDIMQKSPLSAGGFLWNLADEGVVRKDQNDTIDVNRNYAPDGIVGPHHEKEGSFYTIKEIWSPVYVEKPVLNESFDGKIKLENRYNFTNLNECMFTARLIKYGGDFNIDKIKQVKANSPVNIAPESSGYIQLILPSDWHEYDLFCFTATDKYQKEIYTWSWNITTPKEVSKRFMKKEVEEYDIKIQESADLLRITYNKTEITFNKKNGYVNNICYDLKNVSLKNGPRFVGFESVLREFKHYQNDNGYIVESVFDNDNKLKWTIPKTGWLKLEYQYLLNGEYDYAGISFNFPESKVQKAILMGNGPYHVWKNRLKGVQFGIYHKLYNNTITGQTWDYPEFKGYYSNLYAIKIENEEVPFTIVTETSNMYLHLFTPNRPTFYSKNVNPPFPDGNISFLNAISPIGTKFSRPEQEGPQGSKNLFHNQIIKGILYFKFGN